MVRTASALVCIGLLSLLGGCAGSSEYDTQRGGSGEVLAPRQFVGMGFLPAVGRYSLFPSDKEVMDNEAIAGVFEQRVMKYAKKRVAVIHYQSGYRWTRQAGTGDMVDVMEQSEERQLTAVRDALLPTPQVGEVVALPALIRPNQMTVPYLREAAARMQADMLFIYHSSSRGKEETGMFKPTTVHASCELEGLLLDTRTGLVVASAKATRKFSVTEKGEDALHDAAAKAEQTAFAECAGQVAREMIPTLAATAK